LVQSQVQGQYPQGFGGDYPQPGTGQTADTLAFGRRNINTLGGGTGQLQTQQAVGSGYDPSRGYGGWTQDISSSQIPSEQYFDPGSIRERTLTTGEVIKEGTVNGVITRVPEYSPPGLLKRVIGGDKAAMGQLAGKTAETLALPLTLAGAAYFMTDDVDEVPEGQLSGLTDPQRRAYDQYIARGSLKDEPGRALLIEAGISPTQNAAELSSKWGITEQDAQTFLTSFYGPQNLAKGGILALQGGGEITGPGSGTSDSIPARLSDGEFVMTADAVRGIGNGNRDLGAARMYDLMSRYERTV
jgi:hypothetical protein